MSVYRSAQGRSVDMAHLAAKNEKVRAVGNMNVNARGDIIDSNNDIVTDGTKRVRGNYNKTVVTDAPKPEKIPQRTETIQEDDNLSDSEKELFDETDEDIKK